jgi:sodium-dependent dicarboxylate transporter 2/3/5
VAVGAIPFLLSMWISDSATTAMVYPIVLGILATLRQTGGASAPRHEVGLLLTISYAALIGGAATPVGTPPNLIGIGMLDKLAGVRIPFFQWMLLAVPIALVLVTIMLVLMGRSFPVTRVDWQALDDFVAARQRQLGPWRPGEKNALFAFLVAVVLWCTPGIVASIVGTESPTYKLLERHVPEGVASLVAALLLFVLPVDWRARRFTLSWQQALRIDWGTVLLFGGGLSLGSLMFSTGLADVLGRRVLQWSGVGGLWGLTAVAVVLAVVLTEMTSNTATASMLVPVMISLASSLGVSPAPPTIAVCLGASMAFMLPVSTPSNAIIYGSGRVPLTSMMRAGAVLDVIGTVVIWLMLRLLCPLLGLA